MKSIALLVCLLSLVYVDGFGQHSNKKKALRKSQLPPTTQAQKDSLEFLTFKKNNPAAFNNKRLPVSLLNGNSLVNGFACNLEVLNNTIVDSVNHNFYPGMPDTSTNVPYSGLKVGGANISLILISQQIMLTNLKGFDSANIIAADETVLQDKKISIGDFATDVFQVRISFNGKLLFDWQPITRFKRQIFKATQQFHLEANKSAGFESYSYGYAICDTTIAVNDQLLVEIKETKNNWMIDRFNITRSEAAPGVAYIQQGYGMAPHAATKPVGNAEKKTF